MPSARHFTIPTLAALLWFATIPATSAADNPAGGKPVLLYSRYFNADGETRYLPDGTFMNLYTDAKQLILPKQTPVIGGLRWAYYTGNLLRLDSVHAARSRPLVQNDLTQRPPKGTRDQTGVLLATAEPGKGRVVVVTDSGWITDDALSGKGIGGVAITKHDNWEIFLRLANWAANRRTK